jgi:hypothetical protein
MKYNNTNLRDSSQKRHQLNDQSIDEEEHQFSQSKQGSQGNQGSIVIESKNTMPGSLSSISVNKL